MVVSVQLSYVDVNVSVAKQMIESDPNLTILDVRTQSEYESGHIQNATLIPVTELAGRLGELDKNKEILVYCASGGRSATSSQTLVDNGFSKVYNMLGGITAWKSAGYWIEIVHNGDLIVDGTQTFVIENCSYTQIGNMQIKNYGTLVVRNSFFLFNETEDWQYEIIVGDSARIVMEDSNIAFSDFHSEMCIEDHSVVVARNVTLKGLHPYKGHNIFVYGNAEVTVNGSEISVATYFQGDTNAYIYDSNFTVSCRLFERSQGEIRNTTVFDLEIGYNSSVALFDSSVFALYLETNRGSIGIDGLKPGFFSTWNSYENFSVSCEASNITLSATSIDDWGFSSMGSQVHVNNSILDLGSNFNSTVLVQNSVIWIQPNQGESEIEIDSSEVRGLWSTWYSGSMLFCNVTVQHGNRGDYSVIYESHFYMSGNITFGESPWPVANWHNSSVTRSYDAIVQNRKGQLISNASLLLKSEDLSLVWNGTTDDFGRADFNLTFADNNYTGTLRLEVVEGNHSVVQNITFLSDTPVIVQMGILGDINGDWTVDIYDAIILAGAYNSAPPSSYWNANTDINGDNIVDIYDAIILANNFGKTA